jgi:hypothetical protein
LVAEVVETSVVVGILEVAEISAMVGIPVVEVLGISNKLNIQNSKESTLHPEYSPLFC